MNSMLRNLESNYTRTKAREQRARAAYQEATRLGLGNVNALHEEWRATINDRFAAKMRIRRAKFALRR